MRPLLVAGIAAALLVGPAGLAQKKPTVRTLNKKLSGVQAKKSALRSKINQNKKQSKAVMADIKTVDGKLTRLAGDIEVTTTRLEAGRKEQKALGTDLKSLTKELASKRELAAQRMRQIYMQGQDSGVVALFASRDLGELATRKSLMERVVKRDRELFEQVQSLHAQVARKKQRQDELVKEVSGLVTRQRANHEELREVKSDKQSLLSQLSQQRAQLRRELDQLEAESRALAAQIRAYQARTKGTKQEVSPFRGSLLRPVPGPITSGFGQRFHPILKERRLHAGVDMGSPSGTPIRAAAPGVVISASYQRGYGNCVIIDHGGGLSTLYAHCSRLYVSAGAKIERGQRIAAVGSTGLATGPHLHFEVRINGSPVNPMGRL